MLLSPNFSKTIFVFCSSLALSERECQPLLPHYVGALAKRVKITKIKNLNFISSPRCCARKAALGDCGKTAL